MPSLKTFTLSCKDFLNSGWLSRISKTFNEAPTIGGAIELEKR